jgi:hypothetical protein
VRRIAMCDCRQPSQVPPGRRPPPKIRGAGDAARMVWASAAAAVAVGPLRLSPCCPSWAPRHSTAGSVEMCPQDVAGLARVPSNTGFPLSLGPHTGWADEGPLPRCGGPPVGLWGTVFVAPLPGVSPLITGSAAICLAEIHTSFRPVQPICALRCCRRGACQSVVVLRGASLAHPLVVAQPAIMAKGSAGAGAPLANDIVLQPARSFYRAGRWH